MKHPELNHNDRSVLKVLDRSPRPISAYDILERSRALKAPVQVYRALGKLQDRGLVHRIEALNAFVACSAHSEQCDARDHRHTGHRPGFVICRNCGAVREFSDRRMADTAADAAGPDFTVELVSMEIYGRCADCRAAA
jgi:Fur family zinc uptake transcriptional regulator